MFGAPSFVLPSGEIFWGQDRLELLERALKQMAGGSPTPQRVQSPARFPGPIHELRGVWIARPGRAMTVVCGEVPHI